MKLALVAAAAALLAPAVLLFRSPSVAPPGVPALAAARSQLAALPIQAETHASSYDRRLFPHWSRTSGTCDVRETVLKRDGENVVTNSSCAAVSGSWYSPYDGRTWTDAADVDIEHLVPLAEAWRSGAHSWTTARRRAFANDLDHPQLWTVTDDVNRAKGDKDPTDWKPPRTAFWCTYATSWIAVKHHWGLTLQASEKTSLAGMLDRC